MLLCDFCSAPNPTWDYPTQTFAAGAPVTDPRDATHRMQPTSDGNWAACDTCHAIIESGDRAALAGYSTALLVIANPDMERDQQRLRACIADLHLLFFQHRTGPAVRICETSTQATTGAD